jgi:hypothetical protein
MIDKCGHCGNVTKLEAVRTRLIKVDSKGNE